MRRFSLGVGISSCALVVCDVGSAVREAPSFSNPSEKMLTVVMSGSTIAFNGAKVKLGEPMASWKKAVPGVPRCTDAMKSPVICTWDEIGLEVGTDDTLKNVKFANIFLTVPERDTDPLPPSPDGSPASPSTVTLSPRHPFVGRIQLDGIDIGSKTSFSRLRASIAKDRNVRCGSRNCSSPHGTFGEGAKIFFELDGVRETDTISSIGLSKVNAYK